MNIVIDDELIEFDWDKWNLDKNWIKHKVSAQEAEQVFADENKVVLLDIKHLGKEERFFLFGKTFTKRLLAIAYTKRGKKVRIISARDAGKREAGIYEETTHST